MNPRRHRYDEKVTDKCIKNINVKVKIFTRKLESMKRKEKEIQNMENKIAIPLQVREHHRLPTTSKAKGPFLQGFST